MSGESTAALWWPIQPASSGRNYYLPEEFYFSDPDFPIALAAQVTARHVAHWSNRYRAAKRTTATGESVREEALPKKIDARDQLIQELFEWLPSLLSVAALSLYKDDQVLLDQDDGIPGVLVLKLS